MNDKKLPVTSRASRASGRGGGVLLIVVDGTKFMVRVQRGRCEEFFTIKSFRYKS